MLADIDGFVFDLDGTLMRRGPDGYRPLPGAEAVIAEVRRSGRPFAVFTNASHAPPAAIAAAVRRGGLDIRPEDVITPVCSALREMRAHFDGLATFAFTTDATRERISGEGVALLDEADAERAEVVLVTHTDRASIETLEAAAYAVRGGAALLTASYAPAYAGANGPILSRGAMLTAAIAHVAERQPTVVGKPSRAAVREFTARLGVAPHRTAVIGDDLDMDIALGGLGGSTTVLVRTGISADVEVDPTDGPDHILEAVAGLLDLP